MATDMRDSAIELMHRRRFAEALVILQRLIHELAADWDLFYLAGQSARLTGNLPLAVEYLARAVQLNQSQPQAHHALGVALQLLAKYREAVEAFRKALEIDPDYELAFNSLALTQRKMGELELALHNYDVGAKALARRLIRTMTNSPTQPRYGHPATGGQLWPQYAMYAAIHSCASDPRITKVAWPTGEQAQQEAKTGEHAGLYWHDWADGGGGILRMFLPNYFNTMFVMLRGEPAYATLIGNRGTVLEAVGREVEARQHFAEAEEFSRR